MVERALRPAQRPSLSDSCFGFYSEAYRVTNVSRRGGLSKPPCRACQAEARNGAEGAVVEAAKQARASKYSNALPLLVVGLTCLDRSSGRPAGQSMIERSGVDRSNAVGCRSVVVVVTDRQGRSITDRPISGPAAVSDVMAAPSSDSLVRPPCAHVQGVGLSSSWPRREPITPCPSY